MRRKKKRTKKVAKMTSSSSPPPVTQAPPPPMECDGYPYPMVPNDIEHECSFYLPYDGNGNGNGNGHSSCGGGGGMLACTLYYHPTSASTTTSSASSTKSSITASTSTQNNNRESILVVNSSSLKTLDRSIPFIIICHGYASWRNQMLLAFLAGGLYNNKETTKQQKFHILRFDFVNNGHSYLLTNNDANNDVCYYSNYQVEYDNLQTIIEFVQQELQCRIACIIGHSKATYNLLKYASEQQQLESKQENKNLHHIPCFVNLSGRYYVPGSYDITKRFTKLNIQDELNSKGQVVVGKCGRRDCVLTKECLQERNSLNTQSIVFKICEKHDTYVLTIHGTQDEMIPASDAYQFEKVFLLNNPKIHELCIVEGANHNYNGLKYNQQLISTIFNFITTKQHLPPVEGV